MSLMITKPTGYNDQTTEYDSKIKLTPRTVVTGNCCAEDDGTRRARMRLQARRQEILLKRYLLDKMLRKGCIRWGINTEQKVAVNTSQCEIFQRGRDAALCEATEQRLTITDHYPYPRRIPLRYPACYPGLLYI